MTEPGPEDEPSTPIPGDPAAIEAVARRLAALGEGAADAAAELRAISAVPDDAPPAAHVDALARLVAMYARDVADTADALRGVDVAGPLFKNEGTDALQAAIGDFSKWMEREALESWDVADFLRAYADALRQAPDSPPGRPDPRPEASARPWLPEVMWLSSTDHPSWGEPRLVSPQALVAGPLAARQYLWLSVEPFDHPPPDGTWEASDVVVTPRFETSLHTPEPGRPVQVHLWVARDPAELATGRFQPGKVASDAWCVLYADRDEAAARAAAPW